MIGVFMLLGGSLCGIATLARILAAFGVSLLDERYREASYLTSGHRRHLGVRGRLVGGPRHLHGPRVDQAQTRQRRGQPLCIRAVPS